MSSQLQSPLRRRALTKTAAVLLVGAIGGAGASVAFDQGSSATKVLTTAAPAATQPVASNSGAPTVSDIYKRTKQGVVDITVTSQSSGGGGPFGGSAGGGTSKAEGSGFVLDKKGDIVTNQHVVDGATSIEVTFADGTKAPAHVVGQDASSDVAVIRVNVSSAKLTPLTFADSSKVQVGTGVIAIGSPFGLSGSLSVGVVSALNRTITSPNNYSITGAIQTDAPINPGNSGGPLLDSNGDVIGMNSQIESNSNSNSGVGFAISSNTVRQVAERLASGGKVSHPYLGVALTDGNGGATASSVVSGSPADKAGIKKGDVVTAIDGRSIGSSNELVGAIQSHQAGDAVTLTVKRAGQTQQVKVTLGNRAS
jgi:putative serine protease PepD